MKKGAVHLGSRSGSRLASREQRTGTEEGGATMGPSQALLGHVEETEVPPRNGTAWCRYCTREGLVGISHTHCPSRAVPICAGSARRTSSLASHTAIRPAASARGRPDDATSADAFIPARGARRRLVIRSTLSGRSCRSKPSSQPPYHDTCTVAGTRESHVAGLPLARLERPRRSRCGLAPPSSPALSACVRCTLGTAVASFRRDSNLLSRGGTIP